MNQAKLKFDAEAVRNELPPLDWRQPREPGPETSRYLRFYSLDFSSSRTDMLESHGFLQSGGFKIASHFWVPKSPAGTVLVVHGYFDHVGIYGHIINYFLDRNYAVVAYDLPGHGLSSGARVTIEDFATYKAILADFIGNIMAHLPAPYALVGQSTGGAIIMDYLLSVAPAIGTQFRKVALLAPLVRPASWFKARMLHSVISPFRDYVRREFALNSNNPEFLSFLKNEDPLQSSLLSARWVGALRRWVPHFEGLPGGDASPIVIQGDRDETVDWQYNLPLIKKKFLDPEVHILPGARHQLVNESRTIRGDIWAILDKHF